MESFPKWVYHATLDAYIVADQAELDELSDEWQESPVDVVIDAPKKRGRPRKVVSE